MKGDVVFAIPGSLDTPTGGYAYDKRMIAELSELGWRPQVSFAEGLHKTIRWYEANAGWVAQVRSGEYLRYYERQYGQRPTPLAAAG